MTKRELVKSTLDFKNTIGKVPREVWALPWAKLKYGDEFDKVLNDFPNDILTARPNMAIKSQISKGDPFTKGTYIDDWGCIFENKVDGIIGEVKQPLVTDEDWQDAGNINIPEEWLSFDIDEVNHFCADTDEFVLAGCYPRPFEQLQFIRGTEDLFVDLTDTPKNLVKALGKMHDFYCRLLEKWAATDVDALMIMDDWGTQNNLLINPNKWVSFFKPLYKDYIDIAKKAGKYMFMHSDGNTLQILPHLIELGLDAINAQIFCMDFNELSKYRGQITFWGEIDRQNILPYGSPAEVEAAVRKVMDAFWANGGVIAQLEFGLGAKIENVRRAFEVWDSYGK